MPFLKNLSCPPAGSLLSIARGTLDARPAEALAGHISACELCSSELHLLGKHRPDDTSPLEAPRPPLTVYLLAAGLPRRGTARWGARPELSKNHSSDLFALLPRA